MRHLLTTLLLGLCAISMSAQSPALTTYMTADACGDEARSQYFIMVVDANQAYNFTQAPPQVQSYCPTGGTAKSITTPPEPQHRTGLGAGTYSVTVTDGNGCVRTATATITQPGSTTLSGVLTHVSCLGNYNGQINLTVTGGSTPYLYNWQDITSGTEPEDRTGLGAGTYTVTVTTSTGCTSAQSFVITQPTLLDIVSTFTNTTCGLDNGTMSGLGIGGVSPYVYDWTNLPGTNDPSSQTNVPSGIYTLKVTDANGCTRTKVYTIGGSTATAANATNTNTTCGLSNGSVILAPSGGGPSGTTVTYTFDWAHIPGTSNQQNITFIPAGTYTVTITSTPGCTVVSTYTVNASTAVNVNSTVTNATCGRFIGSIAINVTGATSPTYDWSHITGTNNPQNASSLNAGIYTVTVTSSTGGCTASKVSTVLGGYIDGVSGTITNSSGGNPNGSIVLTITGGISPFNYNWQHISGTNNPMNATNLNAGTYTVTVTSAMGCSFPKSFTVNSSNLPNPGGNNSELINTQNIDDGTENTSTSEIETLPQDNLVKVYPNPATTTFTIAIPELLGKCQIQIFDASSRLVQQLEGSVTVEVRADNWSAGVYSIKIMPDNQPDTVPIAVNVVVRGY